MVLDYKITGFIKHEILAFLFFVKRRFENYRFMKKCNASISLDAFATGGWSKVSIGRGTRINSNFNLRNKNGKLLIGKNCLIASKVTIIINTYDINKEKISLDNMKFSDVKIEDNVLIGTSVVIMPGVQIGSGAVIGSNSVVIKNVEPFSVVAGAPAKHITYRDI